MKRIAKGWSTIASVLTAGGIWTAALVAQEPVRPGFAGLKRWELDDPAVDAAVKRGLEWLARSQDPGGFWICDIGYKINASYEITKRDASHLGVTSLALMAFLAGGHVPGRGPYGSVLERGLQYVLRCDRDDGYLTNNGTRMYSHAFATLLLAEVYGMTHREEVRTALQNSVNLIVACQNSQGGWRYQPFARESDMSITVCQVVALRAARNIGINVDYATIEAAVAYVRDSAVDEHNVTYGMDWQGMDMTEPGAFRYQRTQRTRATFPLTAAGLTTLYGAAVYNDPLVEPALDYLRRKMDHFNRLYTNHYFFYYGHYYAVQAFYLAGGNHWDWYFRKMRDLLLETQIKSGADAGAWPNGGAYQAGPGLPFGTAVACLILQIPNEYLPIFQR